MFAYLSLADKMMEAKINSDKYEKSFQIFENIIVSYSG